MATLVPFLPENDEHHRLLTGFWNSSLDADLALSTELVAFASQPFSGGAQAGRIALVDGQPAGAVLVSAHPNAPDAMPQDVGWIDAIAVDRPFQRRGIGRRLLAWAEEWLASQGAVCITTGCGPHNLTPGVPAGARPFFRACGFALCDWTNWDVARNLSDYSAPPTLREVPAAAYPARPGQEELLLGFLGREFPGRWLFDAREYLRVGGRISDFMLLWTDRGVEGACKLCFEDSAWPLGRYFPYSLPRPWGQLGFIGVAAERRGEGMGLFLLDAGLRRLRDNGVNGCVIDWTDLLDFYGKAGFAPYHAWSVLMKEVGVNA